MVDLRQEALDLFTAAITEADPAAAVSRSLAEAPLPQPEGRRFLIAVGKAAVPMMHAALTDLPPSATDRALLITNPENLPAAQTLPKARFCEIMEGSHPVPDDKSEAAGLRVLALLEEAGAGDQVVLMLSGGGSALMVAPETGISLTDKAAIGTLLLRSGLEITEMNLVRQQLSRLKGGGFAKTAAPADVQALILSDVIGDDLRAIASGPTSPALGDRASARATLEHAGVWPDVPEPVKTLFAQHKVLEDTAPADVSNRLVGSNRHSLDAMQAAALAKGWSAEIVDDHLTGDVQEACAQILACASTQPADQPTALLFGGETTVQIKGTGLGGRNQELALRFAQAAQALPGSWVLLSGGTDGRDGPTDAAGACVDAGTWGRITATGADPQALLDNNDSHQALSLAQDLIVTGGTGTNVADVQIFLRLP